ncbi:ferritin family protein [bacterium]|nr:ferritin family protein [bacterium]
MSELLSIDEILDFAIESEQDAVDLYLSLANAANNPQIKKMFEEYADEERVHKTKLIAVKTGKRFLKSDEMPVLDLKISDYVIGDIPGPDADYQSVLMHAMNKEKAAFRLYMDLAARTNDPELKDLLLGLAQEEAKHKLHFEIEYDNNILSEN